MAAFRAVAKNITSVTTETIREFLKMSENGFEGVLKKVHIISCENGNCSAEMKIDKEHVNPLNGLHGGLSATLVDCISSFALLTHEKKLLLPSVSVDMHMSYLQGATIGDEIIIDAKTQRVGKTLGYLLCEIRNKATGDLLVKGNHTKYFVYPKD